MKAFLKNYRQAPRKVRLVADLVKGKKVSQAIAELDFLSKRAGEPIKKLINSAVANAKINFQTDAEGLYIKNITVDKGTVMKRFRPMSRGRAFPVHKHMSHVRVELATKEVKEAKVAKTKTVKAKVKK